MVVGVGITMRDWQTTRLVDLLRRQLDEAWRVIEPNLVGLTDDEYFWEPVVGCWGVRRRSEATTSLVWGKGEWVVENSWTPPSPPPFTTIGWRLMHAYDCTNDYVSRGLWLGPASWNDTEVPGSAAGAVEMMTSLISSVGDRLAALDDSALERGSEGDAERPAWAAVSFAFLELTHHCAEVGVLRSLFRAGAASAASGNVCGVSTAR